MGRKLYVGNLPYSATEDELRDLFSKAGAVDTVNVVRDNATGRARGFAFVEMATDADAQKAIEQFNEQPLGGRNMAVCRAEKPPQETPHIPRFPLHHSWDTSQSNTARVSACSWDAYSSPMIPVDAPVPRMSMRTPAKPR